MGIAQAVVWQCCVGIERTSSVTRTTSGGLQTRSTGGTSATTSGHRLPAMDPVRLLVCTGILDFNPYPSVEAGHRELVESLLELFDARSPRRWGQLGLVTTKPRGCQTICLAILGVGWARLRRQGDRVRLLGG